MISSVLTDARSMSAVASRLQAHLNQISHHNLTHNHSVTELHNPSGVWELCTLEQPQLTFHLLVLLLPILLGYAQEHR